MGVRVPCLVRRGCLICRLVSAFFFFSATQAGEPHPTDASTQTRLECTRYVRVFPASWYRPRSCAERGQQNTYAYSFDDGAYVRDVQRSYYCNVPYIYTKYTFFFLTYDPVFQVRIVADEGEVFGHPLVRQSSVLALSKFMCISGEFCERNLSLLFTTLERATDTAVRHLAVESRTNEGASISVPCMLRLFAAVSSCWYL